MFKNNRTIESLKFIVRDDPKTVILVCSCLIFSGLIEAIGISAIFPLITIILETGTELPDSQFTDFIYNLAEQGPYFLCAFVIVSFVLKALMLQLAAVVVAKKVANFSHKLRAEFVNAMLSARINFIFSKSIGQNLAVLTDGSVRAAAAYTSSARTFAGVVQVLVYFAYAVWLSMEATLFSVFTIGVLFLLIRATMSRTRRAGAEITNYIQQITKNMGETLRAVKEAKATGREAFLASYIIDGSNKLKDAQKTTVVVSQTLRNIQDPVTIALALVCLMIFKDILDLEPGYILFILAIYYRMMRSANALMADFQKFIGQESALQSISDLTQAAREARESVESGGTEPSETPQDIVFDNVTMKYGDKTVFTDVSYTVPAKKLCVFKGESGRGKTTSVDLICKLIEPVSGVIKVGNDPLKDIDTALWRRHLGYVDQFPFLFKGTIRDNVLLDLKDVPDEKITECLKLCHLEEFLEELTEGLDFELNEGGSNISGGQRQRIAIARSVIRDPAYLILDEPTSALDSESAGTVFKTLTELSKRMSVIVISHSAQAASYADKVIDFDDFS